MATPVVRTFTYDTTAPATTTIASTNHNGAIDVGDTFTATFGEALNPTTVAATGTLTLSRSNGNTSYGISGLTNGLVTDRRERLPHQLGHHPDDHVHRHARAQQQQPHGDVHGHRGVRRHLHRTVDDRGQQGQFQLLAGHDAARPRDNTATGTVTATRQVMF